jgi:laccase
VLVEHGKTYLLRVINAGFTNDTFFGVAGHRLTVVGTDGRYLKPFTVKTMMIAPGQTMNALLVADRPTNGSANSRYYMVGRTFGGNILQLKAGNATAILEYTDAPPSAGPPDFIELSDDDNAVSTAFTAQLRSLVTKDHPVDVPKYADEHMYVTIAVNFLPCGSNDTCSGPVKNTRLGASLNNVSFVAPSFAILEAYYHSIQGVYETNFPNKPPYVFNFTNPLALQLDHSFTKRGTKVKVVEYGTVVEVVFQDTGILAAESHPIHLHGFSFYVVGRGFGNYDLETHTPTYNLVDPPYQNTVSVPKAGWAAIRFRATNPGENLQFLLFVTFSSMFL